jgi:hypothetical protein
MNKVVCFGEGVIETKAITPETLMGSNPKEVDL